MIFLLHHCKFNVKGFKRCVRSGPTLIMTRTTYIEEPQGLSPLESTNGILKSFPDISNEEWDAGIQGKLSFLLSNNNFFFQLTHTQIKEEVP